MDDLTGRSQDARTVLAGAADDVKGPPYLWQAVCWCIASLAGWIAVFVLLFWCLGILIRGGRS